MYTSALLAINLDTPPTLFYFFQPASLASFLFRNFQFISTPVVGSLLSPLDLCKYLTRQKLFRNKIYIIIKQIQSRRGLVAHTLH